MRKSLKARVRQLLPRSICPHAILAGPLRGASIYTSWHDYPGAILGTTEKPLLDWLHGRSGRADTVAGIAANYRRNVEVYRSALGS